MKSTHCWRMAGAMHGMCELTRHGMAGERHGSVTDRALDIATHFVVC
jgi:hypothetical protein